MAQVARAPATAKAAPKKEQNAQAVAQPKRTTAPAAQRVAPRSTPCACGGHCPKCQRATPAPAIPLVATEDSAAEKEAELIAMVLATGLGAATPLPPDENSGNVLAGNRQAPPARPRIQPTTSPDGELGTGSTLPDSLRQRLELELGFDLSAVRVHTGQNADRFAARHHARALTYGSHLIFARGEYAPHQRDGMRVLAHEMVHVVQQCSTRDPWSNGTISQQARPRGPPQHGPSHLHIQNHFSQPRVQCWRRPTWDDVSNTVVNAGSAVADTAVDLGTSAVGVAVDVGEGALEIGAEVVERTADFFIGLIDEYAPGLLEFLRGGFMPRLTDLFCRGLDAVIGGLIGSLENIDFVSALEEAFASAQGGVEGVIGAIQSGASSALGALMEPVVEALNEYGPGIIDAITGASDSVNGFFDSIWDSIGAPALDFLGDAGGAIWQEISDMIDWLWDATADVREAAADAWDWVMEQFDIAWDSTSGIRDWLSEKATEAWESMKEALGPLEGPITVLLGVIVILSPLGPIIIATQVIPPLWEKLIWLWNNWNTDDILVWAQDTLREDILPGVIGLVSGVASAIASAALWIAGITVQVADAFGSVLSAFGANTCLATVTRVLNAVSSQFERLAAWAEGGFTGLAEAVSNVFNSIVAILQPILDFLIRLVLVVANPPMLPIAITGVIWLLIPDDLKPPVINFVLDLIIAFLRGFPAFLTGLGPLASILKAATLGFLQGLRDQEDLRKIAATNKIANLMAGAGLQFIAGFAVGILEGLIDGILDPFRLIWMLVQFLARVCRAIGDYLAPLLFEAVPPVGAAVAGFNASVRSSIPDHPPAHAPPASSASGTLTRREPEPTAASTSATTGEISTLSRGTPGSITGPTSSAPPGGGASSSSPAVASPEDATMAEIMGGGPTRSDADIVASLSPGIAGELTGAAGELDAVSAEGATSAESELRSEGSSVSGLSGLLGGIWNSIIEGATNLGARAANALVEFIMLPDYELGNKIGYVAGLVLLEVIVAYFSGGVSVELKAAEPFIKAAIRFLDLGGEILGLLGRAIRPIKGPLLRGLSAAGEHLGRFRFLQPIIQRIRQAANTLFHFGDEAADAASRAGSRADDVARGADDVADVAGAGRRADDAADAAGAGRRADDAADASRHADEAGDTARKAAELPVAMAAAEAICAANDRIEPSPPTPVVHAQLNTMLRPRFPWINGFFSILKAPGVYEIHMQASDHVIDRRYTAGATADSTGVTRHEPGPDPIVEHRSRTHPDTPDSSPPRPHPDAPEPREPFPDLADEADDLADEVADPRRADDFADEVGETSVSSLDSHAIAREAGIPDEILGDATVITRNDLDDVIGDRPLGHGREAPPQLGPVEARPVSRSAPQNFDVQEDIDLLRQAGADPDSIRVNQMQVDADELRTGTNRPDLSATINGRRLHIEYDRAPGTRAMEHARRILQNDPDAIVILKIVDFDAPIRRSSEGAAPVRVPTSVGKAARGSGKPLNTLLRHEGESFFHADLSHVRIHDDELAATAATESRAHALAVDNHILLSAHRRDLSRKESVGTVIHEVAHTLQRTESAPLGFGSDNSPAEFEAHHAATNFLNSHNHPATTKRIGQTSRKTAMPGTANKAVMREADEDTDDRKRREAVATVDWMAAIPPITFSDDAPLLIAWARKRAEEIENNDTTDERCTYIAQGLMKVYEKLREYESRAKKDPDGALIYRDFLTEAEVPWTEDRATRLDDVPPFQPLDVVRWKTTAVPPRHGGATRHQRLRGRKKAEQKNRKQKAPEPPPLSATAITFPKQKEMTLTTDDGQRVIIAFMIAATRRGITGDQINWIVSQLDMSNRWTPPKDTDLSTWRAQFEDIPVGEHITLTISNSFTTEVDVLMVRMPSNRDFLLEGYRQGVMDARFGVALGLTVFAIGTLALGGGALLGSSLAAGGGTLGAGGLLGNSAGSLIGSSFSQTVRTVGTHVYLNAPQIYGSTMLYTGAGMTGVALGAHALQIYNNGVHWSDLPQLAMDFAPLAGGYMDYRATRVPGTSSSGTEPETPPTATQARPTTAPVAPEPVDQLAALRMQRRAERLAMRMAATPPTPANDNAAPDVSAPPPIFTGGGAAPAIQPRPVVQPAPTIIPAPRTSPAPVASATPQPTPTVSPQPALVPAPTVQPNAPNPRPIPAPDPALTATGIATSTSVPAPTPSPTTTPSPTPAPSPPSTTNQNNNTNSPCTAPTGLTRNDPIPIQWFKPFLDRNLYPSPLMLDGKPYAIDDVTTLPRGEPIGVDKIFRPHLGKVVQLLPEQENSGYDSATGIFDSTRRKYRDTLRSYGFDWGHRRNLQADHVMDLQWAPADYQGTRDHFNNLWPLDAPANTSAGNTQNNLQTVSFCETPRGPHHNISLRQMKQFARTNPQQRFFGRYFVISHIGI